MKENPMKKNLMKKKSQGVDSGSSFYAEDQVEQMKKMLSDYWSENLDGDAIASILLMGNEGYRWCSGGALIEEFESVFGEDYFSGD
jgi:hypothetical protein